MPPDPFDGEPARLTTKVSITYALLLALNLGV